MKSHFKKTIIAPAFVATALSLGLGAAQAQQSTAGDSKSTMVITDTFAMSVGSYTFKKPLAGKKRQNRDAWLRSPVSLNLGVVPWKPSSAACSYSVKNSINEQSANFHGASFESSEVLWDEASKMSSISVMVGVSDIDHFVRSFSYTCLIKR